MKRLLACTLAAGLAFTSLAATAKVDCPKLNISQEVILMKTWHYGEENVGKGWGVRLSAIAYQESKLGLLVNGKGSYGVFQLEPTTVAFMNQMDSTLGLKRKLHRDFYFSVQESAKYLLYWKSKGYTDYNMYQAYNGGYRRSSKTRHYASSVKHHIKMFKQCYIYKDGTLHEKY